MCIENVFLIFFLFNLKPLLLGKCRVKNEMRFVLRVSWNSCLGGSQKITFKCQMSFVFLVVLSVEPFYSNPNCPSCFLKFLPERQGDVMKKARITKDKWILEKKSFFRNFDILIKNTRKHEGHPKMFTSIYTMTCDLATASEIHLSFVFLKICVLGIVTK